jgi:predicted Zn finger-like uncharacterized protein
MYTQCPECDVAFRVTAQVLKQAAGKVRCGGCGVAFNALLYLSEDNPTRLQRPEAEADAPEFSVDQRAELEADTPPKSISAAQSAALLKTLDQLAGEDIRIEDTGVEWRVLDAEGDDYDDDFDTDPTPTIAHEPMRFDDNTPLPDDFDLDAESAAEPEAAVPESEHVRPPEDSQVDLVFGDPGEWEDLLGALEEPAAPPAVDAIETIETDDDAEAVAAVEAVDDVGVEQAAEQPLDMDTQFAIQAEAMGIDLSGMHRKAELDDVAAADVDTAQAESEADELSTDEPEASIDDDLIAAAFESEASTRTMALEDVEPEDLSRAGILDEDDYLEIITEEQAEESADEDLDAALEFALEDMLEEEDEFASELAASPAPDVPEVAELSEEEMTINMMIDKDLLAIAVEDDDGFTSTIVQKQFSSTAEIPRDTAAKSARAQAATEPLFEAANERALPATAEDTNALFETIIMEGDQVHSDPDGARLAAEQRAASSIIAKAQLEKDRYHDADHEPRRYGMIGAAALLFIVLVLQLVHHSREAFATSAAFQKTVGPIYRMVGSPVTPAWNIKGWRFEATKGSTDDENQVLTIYSRVGNTSDQALPYPLVHVSLTDRFEEIIGSRVLDPAEYLVGNADPRHVIAPGDSFDAVFTIASPSAEATGFKLNVCYRQSSGQLRCAIEDFK